MNRSTISAIPAMCLMAVFTALAAPGEKAGTRMWDCGADSGNVIAILEDNGTLRIRGSGAMKDFARRPPWNNYDTAITRLYIDDGVTHIGDEAFYWLKSLKSATISGSVVSIGNKAFLGCTGLISVTIQNGVISIGAGTFEACTSLKSVTIPGSVRIIEERAFAICIDLTSISVANDNAYYSSADGVLFNKNKDTLLLCPEGKSGVYTIPNSVTAIGKAFTHNRGLTTVTIPNSVTFINDDAFFGCFSLTSITVAADNPRYASERGVLFNKDKTILMQYPRRKPGKVYTIPNSVTSIGETAFFDCENLVSVIIPRGVISIGESAFSGSDNLKFVTIPSSVAKIGDAAFGSCTSLVSINVHKDNAVYSSIDGVLFNKAQDVLLLYPSGRQGAYAIPNGVTATDYRVFIGGCGGHCGLTAITIPGSMTYIDDAAFMSCPALISVTIENGVQHIGPNAFNRCGSLKSVTIPNSVTSIGTQAFYACRDLASLTLPDKVTSIGDFAFGSCTGLTSVTSLNPVPPDVERSTFFGLPPDICLYVPVNSIPAYRAAAGWKEFKCIKAVTVAPKGN